MEILMGVKESTASKINGKFYGVFGPKKAKDSKSDPIPMRILDIPAALIGTTMSEKPGHDEDSACQVSSRKNVHTNNEFESINEAAKKSI